MHHLKWVYSAAGWERHSASRPAITQVFLKDYVTAVLPPTREVEERSCCSHCETSSDGVFIVGLNFQCCVVCLCDEITFHPNWSVGNCHPTMSSRNFPQICLFKRVQIDQPGTLGQTRTNSDRNRATVDRPQKNHKRGLKKRSKWCGGGGAWMLALDSTLWDPVHGRHLFFFFSVWWKYKQSPISSSGLN